MRVKKVLASSIAKLDSNIHTGGGTDDTAALQAVLDEAGEDLSVHLVIDGVALVTGLRVHSNTTIECLNRECGFFLAPHSNQPVLVGGDMFNPSFQIHDIKILGGTYNQDCINQDHISAKNIVYEEGDFPYDGVNYHSQGPYCMAFYGVRFLHIDGITLRDFKAYALTIDHFENVTIENTWLDLTNPVIPDQDGFHFFGPGRFLTIRNVGGRVGDDFMNIGSDERDRKSSITDVLIDGVFLDHATQAIRLLARHEGSVERVTIRNVSGTYRCFGFYICPWYMDHHSGKIADIVFENINLVAEQNIYNYRKPMLFCVAGIVENLTIRNVSHRATAESKTLVEFGIPYCALDHFSDYIDLVRRQSLKGITLQDIRIFEDENAPKDTDYIVAYFKVDSLILKDVTILKEQSEPNGCLIKFEEEGAIDTLVAQHIFTKGLKNIFSDDTKIKNLLTDGIHKY